MISSMVSVSSVIGFFLTINLLEKGGGGFGTMLCVGRKVRM